MIEPIPEEIVRLLHSRLSSLEELELLLLLRRPPRRSWTLLEISERLAVPESSLEPALDGLKQQGLIRTDGTGSDGVWAYTPGSPDLEALLDRLAQVYDERRLEIMRMLSSLAMERIRNSAARTFADAFVFRRKKDA